MKKRSALLALFIIANINSSHARLIADLKTSGHNETTCLSNVFECTSNREVAFDVERERMLYGEKYTLPLLRKNRSFDSSKLEPFNGLYYGHSECSKIVEDFEHPAIAQDSTSNQDALLPEGCIISSDIQIESGVRDRDNMVLIYPGGLVRGYQYITSLYCLNPQFFTQDEQTLVDTLIYNIGVFIAADALDSSFHFILDDEVNHFSTIIQPTQMFDGWSEDTAYDVIAALNYIEFAFKKVVSLASLYSYNADSVVIAKRIITSCTRLSRMIQQRYFEESVSSESDVDFLEMELEDGGSNCSSYDSDASTDEVSPMEIPMAPRKKAPSQWSPSALSSPDTPSKHIYKGCGPRPRIAMELESKFE